ncbi:hypothetical protein QBC40DRAFT_283933 [Triangularia verruculosa]|uniref:Uncharacterized protein n=1 Tax=Triangularia verruculosa TaxID=2587418 RepID=A0AAN6XF35_9PEZI|nr:hypothetical protein QBC40DRAFT_283933 [Triangularia verruculosa]
MYGQGDGGTTSSLDLECTRAELHAKVLPRIFGGLNQVGKAHLEELDKVLTGFTAALKPFKLPTPPPSQGEDGKDGSPQPHDLKLAVQVNYVKSIDITGGSGSIYIHKPFTRIVIFTVKPQQWASALQKSPKKDSPPDEGAEHDKPSHDHDHADKGGDAAVTTAAIGLPSWLGGKPKPKPPKPDEKIKFTLKTTVLELEFDDAKYRANKSKFEGIFKGMAEDDEELGLIAEEGGLEALGRRTCQIYQANEA